MFSIMFTIENETGKKRKIGTKISERVFVFEVEFNLTKTNYLK